ncbi:Uncharacterized protein Rs2_02429 [Raphanus sativus]|nr:Uncharacterized protein Rs2_02429 [Raphanus sativus]
MVDWGSSWYLVSVIAAKAQIDRVSICSRHISVVRRKRSSEEVVSVEARCFTSSGESREVLRLSYDAAAVRLRRKCHVQIQSVVLMRYWYVRWKISREDHRCCARALASVSNLFSFPATPLQEGGRASDRHGLGFPRFDGLGVGSSLIYCVFLWFLVWVLGLSVWFDRGPL